MPFDRGCARYERHVVQIVDGEMKLEFRLQGHKEIRVRIAMDITLQVLD